MAAGWEDMVTVGRIVRPHGHRGSVVVAPESDFAAERFRPGTTLLWKRAADAEPVRITSSREYRGRWVMGLEGVATMNDAEECRGLELRVPAEARMALAPGAFYGHDLEGCDVVTVAGAAVGRVVRVDLGPGTPVLVLEADGAEVLVPLAEAICREIDVVAKRIVIDPPEGLIELNRPRAK